MVLGLEGFSENARQVKNGNYHILGEYIRAATGIQSSILQQSASFRA